jgi:hypothetical protein
MHSAPALFTSLIRLEGLLRIPFRRHHRQLTLPSSDFARVVTVVPVRIRRE